MAISIPALMRCNTPRAVAAVAAVAAAGIAVQQRWLNGVALSLFTVSDPARHAAVTAATLAGIAASAGLALHDSALVINGIVLNIS
jgi:hypothetical protein